MPLTTMVTAYENGANNSRCSTVQVVRYSCCRFRRYQAFQTIANLQSTPRPDRGLLERPLTVPWWSPKSHAGLCVSSNT